MLLFGEHSNSDLISSVKGKRAVGFCWARNKSSVGGKIPMQVKNSAARLGLFVQNWGELLGHPQRKTWRMLKEMLEKDVD